ncbi:MAG: opacity protein-like surface antigen [Halieaceae bacterium]|jgi:opacity protein-like surface antigen
MSKLSSCRSAASSIFVVALFLQATAQAADRIELRDGSIVMGTFKDADGGEVTIETTFAGTLTIDQSSIVAMTVESDLVLQMEDGQVLETARLQVDGERLALEQQAEEGYMLAQLKRINPEPWELGNGYNFTGLASFGFNSQRGNTETDDLDYRFESRWEGLRDRFRVDAFGELNEAQGTKNAENWTLRARYDRVQTGNWYWGAGASLQQDLFADLDLRSTVGPYIGREFFSDPVFKLEAETGLAYISEDFVSAEDRDYLGSTWDVHISSNYLGGDSRLYVDHKGIWNLDEASNIVLNTTFGLAFPLLYGVEASAELVLDLNTGAVEGTEELDQTYRVRLGYAW